MKPLLLTVAVAVAYAQDAAPQPPSADATKAVLQKTVEQFYQLQVDKKYRQAESMIADDTKDDYYNSRKPDIKGFSVDWIELLDNNTRAKVQIKAKVLILIPGSGAQIFDMPTPTYWKVENGDWRWCIPAEVRGATPFGKMQNNDNAQGGAAATAFDTKGQAPGGIMNPDLGALQGQLNIDGQAVELTKEAPDRTLTITNGLPGPTDLRIDPHVEMIKGLTVKVDKLHLEQGEKTEIHFHRGADAKFSDTVEIVASPLNRAFDIAVHTK